MVRQCVSSGAETANAARLRVAGSSAARSGHDARARAGAGAVVTVLRTCALTYILQKQSLPFTINRFTPGNHL